MTRSQNYAEETCQKNHDSSQSTQDSSSPEERVLQNKQDSDIQGYNEKETLGSPRSSDTALADSPLDHDGNNHTNDIPKSSIVVAEASAPIPSAIPHSDTVLCKDDAESFPEGGFKAWLVVFGSFSAQFIIYGIINSTGALQAYLLENQLKNNAPEQVSWIFSLNLFIVFFFGIYAGRIFDTKGPRALVAVGSGCLVLSMFLLSLCTGRSMVAMVG